MIKKAFILSILLTTIFFSSVASTNDWETFTNTTHIFDVTYTNNQLSIASWGGLDIYQKDSSDPFARDSFERIRTINNINGLGANDIRALAYSPETESYWLSVYNKGINILNSDGKVTVIDEELLGLPSNKVSKIILDGLFYVATDGGLGIYQTHEDLSFPLLLSQYTVELTSGGLVSDNILDLVLTESDYLVMATNMGISYVHRDSLSINSAWNTWDADNSQLPDNMVTVLSTKDDILAIGTKSGAFVVTEFPDSLQSSVITEINSNMFPPVSTIFIDSYNKLWLSFGIWDEDSMIYTDNIDIGIANMSLTGVIEATWGLGDSGLDILNITSFKEIENTICATTWGEGILFFENEQWNKLKTDCIGFNSVKSIETDSNNKTWFSAGTYGDYMTKKGTRGVSSFDGVTWETYNVANSPLNSDNINTIAVDKHNRKWFGAWATSQYNNYNWTGGLTVLDDNGDEPTWYRISTTSVTQYDEINDNFTVVDNVNGIFGSTVPHITINDDGYVLVSCYDRGLSIYYPETDNPGFVFEKKEDLRVSDNGGQKVTVSIQTPYRYYFAMNRTLTDSGKLYYWDRSDLPNFVTEYPAWDNTNIYELQNCTINAMETFTDPFGRQQTWIAANTGLFMYMNNSSSENGWYQWGTNIKREFWSGSSWEHTNYDLYYVDEERLFSSNDAEPMSLFYDPFGILWIGSNGSGMSAYDPYTERFTNYSTANSPLLSDIIVSFGHDPESGILFIGTTEGLSSFKLGITANQVRNLFDVKAYPSPYRPDADNAPMLRIENVNLETEEEGFPDDASECKIFDTAGDLVITLEFNNNKQFTWDGNNDAGRKCSSGIYFYVISGNDDYARGKFALIR